MSECGKTAIEANGEVVCVTEVKAPRMLSPREFIGLLQNSECPAQQGQLQIFTLFMHSKIKIISSNYCDINRHITILLHHFITSLYEYSMKTIHIACIILMHHHSCILTNQQYIANISQSHVKQSYAAASLSIIALVCGANVPRQTALTTIRLTASAIMHRVTSSPRITTMKLC